MYPSSNDVLLNLKGVKLPDTVGGDGAEAWVGEPAADGGLRCTCTGFAPEAGCPRCDGRGSEN